MRLEWDKTGERFYETGVDRGVLFPLESSGDYGVGVPWNGISNVTETPSGAESTPVYADNIKYLNLLSNEDFGCSVEAYTYPDEFEACNGTAEIAPGVRIGQQARKGFGFAYRTLIGNDVEGTAHGYKIHLVYGALASPSEKSYSTVNDSPEATPLSWEITTTPINVTGFKPTAHVEIDSRTTDADKLAAFEAILYGTDDAEARLPLPNEVATLMGAAS